MPLLGGRICLDYALHLPERVGRLVLADCAGLGRVTARGMLVGTLAWALRKLLVKGEGVVLHSTNKSWNILWNYLKE